MPFTFTHRRDYTCEARAKRMIQLNKHWMKVTLAVIGCLMIVCMVGLLTGDLFAVMIAGPPGSFFAVALFIIVLIAMLLGNAE